MCEISKMKNNQNTLYTFTFKRYLSLFIINIKKKSKYLKNLN